MKPCHWHIDCPWKHKYTHARGHRLCLVNGNTVVMSLSWTTPMWWVNECSLAGKNYKWPASLGDRRSWRSVSFANTILCVTYPSAFTFVRQCDRKPCSNNALTSIISVSFQLKRHCELQESPSALPSSTFSIMPLSLPFLSSFLPLPPTPSPAQLVSFPPCSTDLPL